MVGILEFFSAPFFSKPLKAEPYRMHWVVGIVYKLGSVIQSFFDLKIRLIKL